MSSQPHMLKDSPLQDRVLHEEQFVRAFIQKQRRERAAFLLSDPKRRRQFTEKLAHFRWFDERFATRLTPSLAHSAADIVSLLRSKGAGPMVWVISEIRDLDGQALPIHEGTTAIYGQLRGSVLLCIPGKLAFFRGEEMKSETLLEHP